MATFDNQGMLEICNLSAREQAVRILAASPNGQAPPILGFKQPVTGSPGEIIAQILANETIDRSQPPSKVDQILSEHAFRRSASSVPMHHALTVRALFERDHGGVLSEQAVISLRNYFFAVGEDAVDASLAEIRSGFASRNEEFDPDMAIAVRDTLTRQANQAMTSARQAMMASCGSH